MKSLSLYQTKRSLSLHRKESRQVISTVREDQLNGGKSDGRGGPRRRSGG